MSDIEFGGHGVAAGTHVILATTATHGRSELFAEPDRFDPTRYSPERAEHRTPGAYVHFGVGTHTCAGRGLIAVIEEGRGARIEACDTVHLFRSQLETEDVEVLPPITVLQGSYDILRPDAEKFGIAARDAGNDIDYHLVPAR